MQGAEEGAERSHDPTERKLEQAREKGDLPRSQDAQTLAAYAGLAGALALSAPVAAAALGAALIGPIAHPEEMAARILHGGARDLLPPFAAAVALPVLPALLAPAAAILILLAAQRAIVLAPSKLAPKLSRISPLENAKQKYGASGLVEFAKAAVKLAAVSVVLAIAVAGEIPRLPELVRRDARFVGQVLEDQLWAIFGGVILVATVLALFDLLWQRHHHQIKMRMSHQELKEEARQAEGDPILRQARRERARTIAANRMLHDVPNADVVLTNPTHYAVALKWERGKDDAPVCLAKGVDEMAHRIREAAERAGVPVREDPATARSVHALVEIGQEVRPEHYKAVAAAIVFADRLRAKGRRR